MNALPTTATFKDCICVITGALKSVITLQTKGSEFFYGSYDGAVRSFDLKSGKRTHVFRGHNSVVSQVVMDNNNGTMYSASHDGDIRVWKLGAREPDECLRVLTTPPMTEEPKSKVNDNPINCLAISTERNILVTDRLDGTLLLWSTQTGELLKAYSGHASALTCVLIQDNYLFSGSRDSFVKVVDLDTDQIVAVMKPSNSQVKSLCVSGNRVFIGCGNGNIYLYDLRMPSQVERLFRAHTEPVLCLAIYEDHLLSGSDDTMMLLWSISDAKVLHVFTGHTDAVSCICITAENEVYTGSYDCSIRKWAVSGVLQNLENERILDHGDTSTSDVRQKRRKKSPTASSRSRTPTTPKTPKRADGKPARGDGRSSASLSKQNSLRSLKSAGSDRR